MTVGVFRAAVRSDLKISLHRREQILFSRSFALGIVLDQSAIERAIAYFFGRLRCSRSFTNELQLFRAIERSCQACDVPSIRVYATLRAQLRV